ncbi:SDR family oxidoreductase [Nocardia yamanashiensis]|uniref:SDR family NAD(P)-dependent oxidoreductase n=1 Tax=Nocardia yamanashiensis TaxID=209247 RepID=UPI001E29A37A|nr:SDR family oxidoreductase [Nocardia yamanashiensis]UGT44077.1 SDR family oxidoreductase [Nocardia yamanashiensis]
MDLDLEGKRALITGGSRGIGLAIARTLLSEGASVSICARDARQLTETAEKLSAQARGSVYHRVLDVADRAELTAFVHETAEALGGLDIVVANASASVGADDKSWEHNFATDLMSLVTLIDAATPYLTAGQAGAVVAIASTSALEAGILPTANSFGAFKAAMLQHAAAKAKELAPQGIRVNSVSPGPVYFEGGVWEQIKNGMPELYQGAVAATGLGKLASAEDVANAVAFLASPAAGQVTGTNLVIDGGFTNRFDF